MAKKIDSTTNPAAPEKRAVKPAAAKTKAAPKATKAPAAKVPAAKAKSTAKPAAKAKPSYTQEDIALRAYYIAEKRRTHGLPGDEHQDWLEAERQILAESSMRKKTKKA